MNLKKIIPVLLVAMSLTVVTPVLASLGTPVAKTANPADQRSKELLNWELKKLRNVDKSDLTKEEKQALKEEKRELKQAKKDKNGRILGLGILGVVVVVLLCVWIF